MVLFMPAIKHTLAISTFVLILVAACGQGEPATSTVTTSQVRGHIVEVIGRNITEVDTLRVRDDAGREFTFTTEGYVGITPSHLKEHQLFGQSVLVSYVEKGTGWWQLV